MTTRMQFQYNDYKYALAYAEIEVGLRLVLAHTVYKTFAIFLALNLKSIVSLTS